MIRTFDDASVLFDDPGVTFDGLYFSGPTTTNVNVFFDDGVATEITWYVRQVTVRRGRSRELDTFTSGQCSIVLNNEERLFDPLYRPGPFFGKIVPRLRVQVLSDGISLFDGFVEDWNLGYSLDRKQDAEIVCVDGLALLAQTTLDEFTNGNDTPGTRIAAVLNRSEVSYSGAVDLDGGFVVMQTDTVRDATNTLSYLQTIADTDQGRLFVDGSGVLQYRDRTFGVTSPVKVIFGDVDDPLVQQLGTLSDAVLWFDASGPAPLRIGATADASVILQDAVLWFDADTPDYVAPIVPFSDVGVEIGSEFLYNRVTVTRLNGDAQVASAVDSERTFGIRALAKSNSLFLNDTEAADFAAYLAGLYAEPQVRVKSHDVVLAATDEVRQRYVRRLEIGDLVRTVWSPYDSSPGLDVTSVVEGVEHEIAQAGVNEFHRVRLQLTPAVLGGFILDDANDGLLDTSELTY